MAKYFNTTLGLSMLQDGNFSVTTVTEEYATGYLADGDVLNVANPSHGNTLDAVSRRLGVNVRGAKGGRVLLDSGDLCLIVEIGNVPRETREFTDDEIGKATFKFRLVVVS